MWKNILDYKNWPIKILINFIFFKDLEKLWKKKNWTIKKLTYKNLFNLIKIIII
jgi:hypothetical protein